VTEAVLGAQYRIASVYERDRELLEFFDKEGIRPGVHIGIEARNYDGTISVSVERRQIRPGTAATERVWVDAARGALSRPPDRPDLSAGARRNLACLKAKSV